MINVLNYRRIRMKIKYIFAMLIFLLGTQVFAQVDPTKVLVGRWDGYQETSKARDRTLVITSLKPTGDGVWAGPGKFGIFGEDSYATEINVSSKGADIVVEFVDANSKAPVVVKLIGENKLEGTIETLEFKNVVKRKISFEKK